MKPIQNFWIDVIFGSSVVEGDKLTRKQVADIVKNGKKSKLLRGSPNEDLLQAYGQSVALSEIEKRAKQNEPVTVRDLQELHFLVFESSEEGAGKFREHPIALRRTKLMPAFPFSISADLRDFNDWLISTQESLDRKNIKGVIALVAKCYHQITKIHPFSDGNGRISRMFINLLLRKYGLPHILVPKVDNEPKIREALRAADLGDIKPLEAFIDKLLKQSLKRTSK